MCFSAHRPVQAQRAPSYAEERFSTAYQLYADQLYPQAADAFFAFRQAYPDHPSAAEALYYEAESALALGRLDEAIVLFRQFEREAPAHPLALKARLALGQYFYESGDYDRGLETLQGILDDDPPPAVGAQALYWMASAASEQGRPEDALRYYRQAANSYANTETAPQALYAAAYLLVQQDAYDQAVDAFELLVNRYPDSPYARNIGLALAEVYYELGNYRRAISEIDRRFGQLEPEAQERATFLKAESYNQLEDYEEAVVYYQRLTEQGPRGPYYRQALYGLGWNYHGLGNYEWAADAFADVHAGQDDELAMQALYYEAANRKLNGKPGVAADLFGAVANRFPRGDLAPTAIYEQGATLYELRQWEKARSAFTRLVDEYDEADQLGDALRLRGFTNIALNDFDDALDDFDQAIDLDAASVALRQDVLFQKAWLQYRTGAYAEAEAAFRELADAGAGGASAEALFWAAESAYQQDDLGEAQTLFARYLSERPNGQYVDAAHYALGWTHFRRGDYRTAVLHFTTFLNAYRERSEDIPYRTDALLRLADSYYALKRYDDAIRTYQRVAEAGGDYALFQIGQAHSNAGNAFDAITTFRRLLSEYPESAWREEARYALGYLYFQNQDYDQAIAAYRELIGTFPRDPLAAKAQYGIGDAYYNSDRLDEAIEAYAAVLERYPDSPFVSDAASSIQYALLAIDDDARADAFIESFAARNPGSPLVDELRFRQAEVRYQSGRLAEARDAFTQFIQSDGTAAALKADASYYLGLLEAQRGNTDAAVTALRRAVEAPEGSYRADAAQQLGDLYLAAEQSQAALAAFRRFGELATTPERQSEARFGEGLALLQLGRTDEAQAIFEQEVAQTDEPPPRTLLGLARVYEASSRPADAMRSYQRVIDASRDEAGAEALYRLGALLLARDEAQVAIGQLSRMSTLYGGYPDWVARAYLLQAQAFEAEGQTGEAARTYDLVISEFGGTPYAQQAARAKDSL